MDRSGHDQHHVQVRGGRPRRRRGAGPGGRALHLRTVDGNVVDRLEDQARPVPAHVQPVHRGQVQHGQRAHERDRQLHLRAGDRDQSGEHRVGERGLVPRRVRRPTQPARRGDGDRPNGLDDDRRPFEREERRPVRAGLLRLVRAPRRRRGPAVRETHGQVQRERSAALPASRGVVLADRAAELGLRPIGRHAQHVEPDRHGHQLPQGRADHHRAGERRRSRRTPATRTWAIRWTPPGRCCTRRVARTSPTSSSS